MSWGPFLTTEYIIVNEGKCIMLVQDVNNNGNCIIYSQVKC